MFRKLSLLLAVSSCSFAVFAQAPSSPKQPLAVAGGQPIYEDELLPLIQTELIRLRSEEYELRMKYLDGLINQKLIDAEAKKRNISPQQLMDQEITAKAGAVTDAEIELIYNAQKDRIGRPLADVKEDIRRALQEQRNQQTAAAFFKTLRAATSVDVMLEPPRVKMGIDPGRVRGNPNAPVTIVEFSDFQCPFCLSVESTVRGLLSKYDGKVRLAFRDYPLVGMHANAESAGEAALCAGDQGKFWEYHDLIYGSQSQLDHQHLMDRASQLKLDTEAFGSCLTTRKYKAKVEQDIEEGNKAGVTGTPGFFINGVFLNGAQPASTFERIIDQELALLKRQSGAAQAAK